MPNACRRGACDRFLAGKLPTLDQAPIEKNETLGEKIRAQMLFVNYFSKPKKDFGLDLTPDVLDTLCGAISMRPGTTARCRASS